MGVCVRGVSVIGVNVACGAAPAAGAAVVIVGGIVGCDAGVRVLGVKVGCVNVGSVYVGGVNVWVGNVGGVNVWGGVNVRVG
jgi:hypothetical protein